MWLEHTAGGGVQGLHEQVFTGLLRPSFPPPPCPSSVQHAQRPRGPPVEMDCMPLPLIRTPEGGDSLPASAQALPVLPVPAHCLARPGLGGVGWTNRKMAFKGILARPHSKGLKAEGGFYCLLICGALTSLTSGLAGSCVSLLLWAHLSQVSFILGRHLL